ncbi:HAD-IA family hydrolase [Aliiglaciecola sp. 2_MG-2023]|uniref:HAD family hydrolase n=1 Tax=unclassified Aliiglaciecola TaxID=2593648 RepID=UPI0026E32091|nr:MULTISPECIES: HAD-IA family hydrolase [unclassified Aliiglaciecola]MDO6709365.1 HAD-IA family hydrolase [Aliiglaciecola sp. 2_MG-2023]MDO6750513.1 HAD-IA family hydrolase [Aliiglaciecola sp. 1_MG-2023]
MFSLISDINSFVENHNIKVVSLDLFDTLIFRKVSKPADIFSLAYTKVKDELLLGLENKEFQELRVFAERKAKKQSFSKEVTLEEIYDYMPFTESIKQTLLKSELITEAEYSFLYQPMVKLAESLSQKGILVIFLSDMYLSKEQIQNTFLNNDEKIRQVPLFVSSEYRKNKSSGLLFKHVKQQLGLEYSQWLHVGDNIKSDFELPKQVGLHAIHASGELSAVQIFKTERSISPLNCNSNAVRQIVATYSKSNADHVVERTAFELGAFVWGPALFAFADWVIDITIKVKSATILCLMREAEVFAPLISLRLSQREIENIDVKKLFVSRKSALWPSINFDSKNWLNELVTLMFSRRGYKVDDFYRDFQLPPDALHGEFKLDLIKNAEGLYYQGNSLLSHLNKLAKENIGKIKNVVKQQKERFFSYYNSQISTPFEQCTVVDFGYGGTIQHYLQMIFSQSCAANLLFISSDRIYRNSQTTAYYSFINAANDSHNLRRLLCRSSECIETFLLGDRGTTLRYADDHLGTPILAPKLKANTALVNAFLDGAIDYVDNHHQLGFKNISNAEVMNILLRYVQYPTKGEAELLTQIMQQDNFGSSNAYAVISTNQIEQVKQLGVECAYLEFSRNIKWKIDNLHWPQAILNLLSDTFMQKQHGLLSLDTENDAADLAERILARGWTNFSVYGAGVFFEKLLPHLNKNALKVDMVIDRKAEVYGPFQHLGYDVVSLNHALESNCEKIVICSKRFKDEITKNLREQFIQNNCEMFEILSL